MFYPGLFSRNWFGIASDIPRRINIRCTRTKHLIDDDAVVDRDAGFIGQGSSRRNTNSEHDQVGIDEISRVDLNLAVENLPRFGVEHESDPMGLVKFLDEAAQ